MEKAVGFDPLARNERRRGAGAGHPLSRLRYSSCWPDCVLYDRTGTAYRGATVSPALRRLGGLRHGAPLEAGGACAGSPSLRERLEALHLRSGLSRSLSVTRPELTQRAARDECFTSRWPGGRVPHRPL